MAGDRKQRMIRHSESSKNKQRENNHEPNSEPSDQSIPTTSPAHFLPQLPSSHPGRWTQGKGTSSADCCPVSVPKTCHLPGLHPLLACSRDAAHHGDMLVSPADCPISLGPLHVLTPRW